MQEPTAKRMFNAGYDTGAYDGFHGLPFLPDLDKRTFDFAAGYRAGFQDAENEV